MKRKVYIVEDHEVVRESYLMLLELADDLEVCGTANTAEAALEQLPEAAPDLLLVDVSLPGMSGIDLVKRLQADDALVPTLMLTGHDREAYRVAALEAGARGFVMKQDGPDALLEAIRDVLPKPSGDSA